MIQVYSKGNKDFAQNGNITLIADNADVKVELNGAWNLELHHPIDEEGRWKYLVEDAVLKVPSFNGEQLFRIYSREKSEDGVSIMAYPIFFDAKNDCFLVDVRPTNKNGQEALSIMCSVNGKYSAESNIVKRNTSYYEYMNLLEAIGGDSNNSFLRRWGGEVLYDNHKIIINERVGGDYGIELLYGKNIPANGVRESVDMSAVVTRIYPKAFNGRKLTSGFVDSPLSGNYETVRAITMRFEDVKLKEDVEGDVEENVIICNTQAELDAELTRRCNEQFELGLDKPKVTIEADMVLLQNTEEYKDYKMLESVSLGDTIHCRHDKLGIVTDARVIELEYDCLLDRVTSVKLGDFQKNYFNDVTENVHKIESVVTPEGNLDANKVVGVLNAMNTQLKYQKDIAKKQDVRAISFEDIDPASPTYGAMCLGTQGFQIANKRTVDGRDWDWGTAATANGINADKMITGTIIDKTGKNYWNLDTGDFQLVGAGGGGGDKDWMPQINQAEQNAINQANQALTEYANTVSRDMQTLQNQVDGQVEDWYYDYQPTTSNVPASNWTTEAEKEKHVGDRFFWKSKGYAYRWMKNGYYWEWVLLKDTDITTAMKNAQDAIDIADGKRRTFVSQPIPPYDVGDLWCDGTDIKTCMTARVAGEYYNSYDWMKLNSYTSNTYVDNLISDLQNQVDGKIQTYSQGNDPSLNWSYNDEPKHTGDIWYDTTNKQTKRWTGRAWEILKDKEAEDAMNLANKKAQVFINQPTIPYYVGDLWFTGNEIKTCTFTRESGYYNSWDWEVKNSYTDDTTANQALQNSQNPDQYLTQLQVFNKLTNNGTLRGIFMQNGELYINGTYIQANSISGNKIQADSITSDKLNVNTLSAITANLGTVNSADIHNFLNGIEVFSLNDNRITFKDKYNSREIGGVWPIQEVRDEYGIDLYGHLFAQVTGGNNFIRVRPSGIYVHASNIPINNGANLAKFGEQKVLWSGEKVMRSADTIYLTESILSQPNGIVLMFSAWDSVNNKGADWWWNSYFIPRNFVENNSYQKMCINLSGGADMAGFARKMLAFYDTQIMGDDMNGGTYTAGNVKYENSKFVLRRVCGV